MSLAEFSEAERADVRARMTRFLRGAGVELGPGHIPMPLVLPGVKVRYVDRWEPEENRELFPELGVADFPQPDIVADLDRDGLSALGKHSQDFVIASHVLEHLANPLAMLAEIYRVLRPGGVTLIFLPDRRRTFDARRAPTPLEHLVAENADGVTSVSDEHIEEFLRGVGDWDDGWTPAERARQLEVHRRRSIHVHCWSQDEFLPVIEHTVTDMGMQWELLDASFTEDFDGGFEFGFALRRSTVNEEPALAAEHLTTTWSLLESRARADRERANAIPPLVAQREALRAHSEHANARLEQLRRLPGYAVARGLWRLARRVRGGSAPRPEQAHGGS